MFVAQLQYANDIFQSHYLPIYLLTDGLLQSYAHNKEEEYRLRSGHNNGKEKKLQVHTCTTSKQIELAGFQFATKPDQPGYSSLIHLKVIMDKRKILAQFIYRILLFVSTQE